MAPRKAKSPIVGIRELSRLTGLSQSLLYQEARHGRLPGARRFGERVVVEVSVFMEYMKQGDGSFNNQSVMVPPHSTQAQVEKRDRTEPLQAWTQIPYNPPRKPSENYQYYNHTSNKGIPPEVIARVQELVEEGLKPKDIQVEMTADFFAAKEAAPDKIICPIPNYNTVAKISREMVRKGVQTPLIDETIVADSGQWVSYHPRKDVEPSPSVEPFGELEIEDIMERLEDAGITVRIADLSQEDVAQGLTEGDLVLQGPPGTRSEELIEEVRSHKPEIRAHLRWQTIESESHDSFLEEERRNRENREAERERLKKLNEAERERLKKLADEFYEGQPEKETEDTEEPTVGWPDRNGGTSTVSKNGHMIDDHVYLAVRPDFVCMNCGKTYHQRDKLVLTECQPDYVKSLYGTKYEDDYELVSYSLCGAECVAEFVYTQEAEKWIHQEIFERPRMKPTTVQEEALLQSKETSGSLWRKLRNLAGGNE